MHPTLKLLCTCTALASLAAPLHAGAAERAAVSCNVAIDYSLNGGAAELYTKDFVVDPGASFVDDFSTQLREKRFTASAAREAGNLVVSIDYFNDVGVFHAVSFNTRLTLRNGRGIDTTAGSNTFSTSIGVPGNHRTNYTLTCRRS